MLTKYNENSQQPIMKGEDQGGQNLQVHGNIVIQEESCEREERKIRSIWVLELYSYTRACMDLVTA